MDSSIANDVYNRYRLQWADFPRPEPPSAHSNAAELFCARLSLAVYALLPDTPHSPRHDYVPSKNRDLWAQKLGIAGLFQNPADRDEGLPEADIGFQTLVTDQAAAALVWWDNHLIIGFRGTANWQDWIHNMNKQPVNTRTIDQRAQYKLHKGFTGLARNIFPPVRQLIHAHFGRQRQPGTLTVCGHSLGGALAMNFAAQFNEERAQDWHRKHPKNEPRMVSATYTFGAPRIGTGNIWDFVARPHYRLRMTGDPVPSLPLNFADDFQATFLSEPGDSSDQPRSAGGKISKAAKALLPRFGVSLKAHDIESYIEAIDQKIKAAAQTAP